ncbi:cytochrome P450 monooxygenase pc-1 [Mycena rebaudengoi]|nr:cytochrome P450 monooxygenase pc-1 [Mycena rebaudengoi]
MEVPPGIRFLARNLVLPAAAVCLAQRVASDKLALSVSVWTALWGSAVAGVVFVICRHAYRSIYYSLHAKSMGARLAPRVKGRLPGNIDTLRYLLETFETGYLGEGFLPIVDSLGPVFNLSLLWDTIVFTVSPEHIQIILATDFNNYVKGQSFRHAMNSVLGVSSTASTNYNGHKLIDRTGYSTLMAREMWAFHRSMTRPYFVRDRVRHFDIFDRHAEKTMALIKSRMQQGLAVDFQDLISRFTMDSATEFLFGQCANSLSASLPYPHNVSPIPAMEDLTSSQDADSFPAAFAEVMLQIAFRERVGWVWPLFEMFSDRTAKPMKTVDKFLDPIIRSAVERKKRNKRDEVPAFEDGDTGDDATLLDELLKSTTDQKLLKDEILNILLAGRETTMLTLTLIVYFLSIHPKVTARLREEIIKSVGPSARPTYDDIKEMKYLKAVINETMRLYPPVPFNIRESVKATTWPSPDPNEKPIYIPAGVKVPYSIMVMQRRKDLWGPDADEFDPDRFLDDRVQYMVSNPFQFLPFNAGPRICLGQQFAYNEMSFLIIRLLQNFSAISLNVDACPPDARVPPEWAGQAGRKGIEQFVPQAHLTMYAKGGLWVKMQQA